MSFLDNLSPEWVEDRYRAWKEDRSAVSPDWDAFFTGYDLGRDVSPAGGPAPADALKQSGVQSLLHRHRDIGHLMACTDPLAPCLIDHPLLNLAAFGLEPSDLDRTFHTRRFLKQSATLREILETMRETYCRSIGVEFMHIQEPSERQWLMDRMEPVRNRPTVPEEEQLRLLARLTEATLFEEFLNRKFPGQTRFSLEGGEALIPFLDLAVGHAGRTGVEEIVVGMPHRGRLAVLAIIFGKPLQNIFAEFADNAEHGVIGEGDVKYHKGYSVDLPVAGGNRLHLTMAVNPSHLEAVDPVVEGKCRAFQDRIGPGGAEKVLPLLIHGDAAFSGQGVVAEVFNLSRVPGFATGGTLHVILNNQIGFTTLAADARSSLYATDMAKAVMAPIFHVQGEDPEAVAHVARLALDYRRTFGRDVVVELICYRRHGHNEGDEPIFTQPRMYELIRQRQPVHRIYADRLRDQGLAEERIDAIGKDYSARLETALTLSPVPVDAGFAGEWEKVARLPAEPTATALPRERLRELAERLARLPAGFTPHPKVRAILERRQEAVLRGDGIDWGNAEALALASLLAEGRTIRFTGQDVRRGTFSQRHAIIVDMATEAVHTPLAGVAAGGAHFHIYDSTLSEYGVLGFEYGYSIAYPDPLVLWEAQYGDFANGAQVIIDQYIVSGEVKWDRVSGLVLLLPHGHEGQGPEHSCARIERFLQLCADDNIQVANPTSPAQYFHLLRRQARQPFRKPLVVFTPKSLLRHPRCISTIEELGGGFNEVLAETGDPENIRAVILCSGKLYYELLAEREKRGADDTTLIRIEQLYPFRRDLLRAALERLPRLESVVWAQEEPENMGAWPFLRPLLTECAGRELRYAGRPAAASPATGSYRLHREEQGRLVAAAFEPSSNRRQ